MKETFLNRKELAERWKCTPQHISDLVLEEKIPAPIPISKRINIWSLSVIEAHEKKQQKACEIKLQPELKVRHA